MKNHTAKNRAAAIIALAALSLPACGGVDRAGTRDQFISDMQERGSTVDAECVDQLLERYSDDDIKAQSEGVVNATTQQFNLELIECTDLSGG